MVIWCIWILLILHQPFLKKCNISSPSIQQLQYSYFVVFWNHTPGRHHLCASSTKICVHIITKIHNIGEYFACVVPSRFSFSDQIWFVKLCRHIFECIITNKWVMLPLFAAEHKNITSISSPFLQIWSPLLTFTQIDNYVYQVKRGLQIFFLHILVSTKSQVHLQVYGKLSRKPKMRA